MYLVPEENHIRPCSYSKQEFTNDAASEAVADKEFPRARATARLEVERTHEFESHVKLVINPN